jgi:hypothetical protein
MEAIMGQMIEIEGAGLVLIIMLAMLVGGLLVAWGDKNSGC